MKSLKNQAGINRKFHFSLILIVLAYGLIVPGLHGQTYTLLHSFTGEPDGGNPVGTVLIDRRDNIYGVTETGGTTYPYTGTIFTATESGSETVLFSFAGIIQDPVSTLVPDAKGDVYGSGAYGDGGGIYEATSNGIQLIYIFTGGGHEEWFPSGNIVRDDAGDIYGVTEVGGHSSSSCAEIGGCGTVFKVTPAGKATILHNFSGGTDGAHPLGGLTRAPNGDIYGTTDWGGIVSNGNYGDGTIFKIDKSDAVSVVFRFNGTNGALPYAPLIFDPAGNAYSTTYSGGAFDEGVVFEISPSGGERILHSFGKGADGNGPWAGLVRDADGNLYGTTEGGGIYNRGTVFRVTPTGTGTVLYNFTGNADGGLPISGLAIDSKGNLIGATFSGGIFDGLCMELGQDIGCGTLFEITP
jgi:uncharacterized repeat protein (TIGR03803 family)